MGGVKKQLPHGWAAAKLREVTSPRNEKVDPRYIENKAYISLEHIESGTNQIVDVGSSGDVRSTKAVFYSGDILYAKLRPYLNKVCQPDFDGVCSTDILVFEPSPGLDNRFLLRLLSRGETVEYATTHSKGINLPRVNLHQLGELRVELPPLEEQSRIVTKIEELQAHSGRARDALETVPDLLEQLRQSILAAAFRGDLTKKWREDHPDVEPASELLKRIRAERRKRWEESELEKLKRKGLTGEALDSEFAKHRKQYKEPAPVDDPDLPKLPDRWCWVNIDQLAFVVRGASPRPAGNPRYFGGNIPWITVASLTADTNPYLYTVENTLTEEGMVRSRYIYEDTLLLTNSGATLGVPKITKISGCINDGVAAMLGIGNSTRLYLYYYLLTLTHKLRRINQGAAQPNLNTDIIRNLAVPLAPAPEGELIVKTIEAMTQKITAVLDYVTSSSNVLDKMDQCMLSKAFRGELVPQDPNNEPASVLLERIRSEKERLATEEKPIPKRGGRKMKDLKQRYIIGMLQKAEHPLSPEELFAACGFEEDSVDLFYEQLREAVAANLVTETREGDTVRLKAMR